MSTVAGTMETTSSASQQSPEASTPNARQNPSTSMKLSTPPSADAIRRNHLNLDTFSPINQQGSFEFDRVLKTGAVLKRTRKTKSWKPVHIVLRPNLLSIYKDTDCTKLRHQISLADLTAVARQRDPKRKAKFVFALFSPERNFHIEAPNEREAQSWVELIRREARIDEEEEETMALMSPVAERSPRLFNRSKTNVGATTCVSTSGSEPEIQIRKSRTKVASPERMHSATRKPSLALQTYSGNERGSYSDFSDGAFFPDSSLSLSHPETNEGAAAKALTRSAAADAIYSPSAQKQRPGMKRNNSQIDTSERVIYHGYLLLLKSKNGIRQWKTLWAVLRPKSLTLYKNEEEYSALLVLPFPSILDAVDIDPQSKSKRYCMQVITEERNYRFCAVSEEECAKWLGAFKSLLLRRKEGDVAREKERKALEEMEEAAAKKGKGRSRENVVAFHDEAVVREGVGTNASTSVLPIR